MGSMERIVVGRALTAWWLLLGTLQTGGDAKQVIMGPKIEMFEKVDIPRVRLGNQRNGNDTCINELYNAEIGKGAFNGYPDAFPTKVYVTSDEKRQIQYEFQDGVEPYVAEQEKDSNEELGKGIDDYLDAIPTKDYMTSDEIRQIQYEFQDGMKPFDAEPEEDSNVYLDISMHKVYEAFDEKEWSWYRYLAFEVPFANCFDINGSTIKEPYMAEYGKMLIVNPELPMTLGVEPEPAWHGTSALKTEQQEAWEILGEKILVHPVVSRSTCQCVFEEKPLRRRLRKVSSKGNLVKFDPGLNPENEGHCLYASLKMGMNNRCDMKGIKHVRKMIFKAWLEDSQRPLLQAVSEAEGTDELGYLRDVVQKGWGGAPEIHQFSRSQGAKIRVWNICGLVTYLEEGYTSVTIDLLYHDQHYMLLDSKKIFKCGFARAQKAKTDDKLRGGGDRRSSRRQDSRSRSTRIILISRAEKEARERADRPPTREVPLVQARGEERRRGDDRREEQKRPSRSSRQQEAEEYERRQSRRLEKCSSDEATGSVGVSGKDKEESYRGKERAEQGEKQEMGRKKAALRKDEMAQGGIKEEGEKEKKTKEELTKEYEDKLKRVHAARMKEDILTKEGKGKKKEDKRDRSLAKTAVGSKEEPGRETEATKNISSNDRPDPSIVELYELKTDEGRVCILCGKWLDPQHERAAKHRKQVAYVLELDETNRRIYRNSCKTWVIEHLLQRGGGKKKKEQIPKQEETKVKIEAHLTDQKENLETDFGFEVIADVPADSSTALEPSLSEDDDKTVAEGLALLLRPARSSSDSHHKRNSNDGHHADNDAAAAADDHTTRHHDDRDETAQDNDLASTVQYESDIDIEPQPDGLMIVIAGNRRVGFQTCRHTTAADVISTVAFEMRLMTKQIALVKGNEMLASCSGRLFPEQLAGVWKAWKLPISKEHRQEAGQPEDKEPDRIEDERCCICSQGRVCVEEEEEAELWTCEEETVRLAGEDLDVITLTLERPRDTIWWQAYRNTTVQAFLDEYAAVKRVSALQSRPLKNWSRPAN